MHLKSIDILLRLTIVSPLRKTDFHDMQNHSSYGLKSGVKHPVNDIEFCIYFLIPFTISNFNGLI
jgi:hypothetical protein